MAILISRTFIAICAYLAVIYSLTELDLVRYYISSPRLILLEYTNPRALCSGQATVLNGQGTLRGDNIKGISRIYLTGTDASYM